MYKIKLLLFTAICITLIYGCSKEPGYGGRAIITGKLKVHSYNSDFSLLKDSFYIADEDVYIVFGENAANGDDVNTKFDGSFSFENLRPGKYTIFAYSKDETMASPNEFIPRMKTVEITENNQVIDIGDLVIADNNATGNAKIRGKVIANTNGTLYYAPYETVFIVYDNETTFRTSSRTNFDGSYEFDRLPKGTYKIYVYSEDNQAPAGIVPVIDTAVVDSNNQIIVLPDLLINIL
jgi:hypothetical protein